MMETTINALMIGILPPAGMTIPNGCRLEVEWSQWEWIWDLELESFMSWEKALRRVRMMSGEMAGGISLRIDANEGIV